MAEGNGAHHCPSVAALPVPLCILHILCSPIFKLAVLGSGMWRPQAACR